MHMKHGGKIHSESFSEKMATLSTTINSCEKSLKKINSENTAPDRGCLYQNECIHIKININVGWYLSVFQKSPGGNNAPPLLKIFAYLSYNEGCNSLKIRLCPVRPNG